MLTLAISSLLPLKANCVLCSTVLPWDLILRKHSCLFNIQSHHDSLWPVIKGYKISLTLISDIQGSFKKCPLLFRQAEMVFVIIWFFDHFSLEPSIDE